MYKKSAKNEGKLRDYASKAPRFSAVPSAIVYTLWRNKLLLLFFLPLLAFSPPSCNVFVHSRGSTSMVRRNTAFVTTIITLMPINSRFHCKYMTDV